jgi:hypothetical protein
MPCAWPTCLRRFPATSWAPVARGAIDERVRNFQNLVDFEIFIDESHGTSTTDALLQTRS